jgi:multidrug efflux system outer membrane protein
MTYVAHTIPFKPLALAVAMLLAGCAVTHIPIEPVQPAEVPAQWSDPAAAQADSSRPVVLDVDWWRQFGSAELSALVSEGQNNNLEIAAAVSRVHQAEANARIAGAPLLPDLDIAGSAYRTLPLSGGSATTTASGLLEVNYEIDFWGKNKAGLVAAEASLRANLYDRETVSLTVTSGIVSTFLQVLSLRDRLEIARRTVSNAQRVLKLVEAQSRAGAASPLDLARQRSALAGQQATIPDLMQQERDAQTALAILLGRPPQTFTVSEKGLEAIRMPQITPGMPSALLTRRPDIRRAEARLAAANANVAVARAALFPSISLTGNTGAQSSALLSLFDGPNLLATLGASLTIPIFDSGRLSSQRDLAVAQKQELVQVYRSTVITALSEVEKALGAIRSLEERYRLKSQEVDQARFAFELSEIRYRVGAEDLMTVIDTQRTLSDAQTQLGLIKLQRLQATVSLYKALGGGWQDDILQMRYGKS